MKKHTLHIGIRILLTLSIFTCGLPAFRNHQDCPTGENTLCQVVRSVRNFTMRAENPGFFRMELKKTITSFHLAAGLSTVIKGYGNSFFQRTTAADISFLIPASMNFIHPPPTIHAGAYLTANNTYHSKPEVPPPRFA